MKLLFKNGTLVLNKNNPAADFLAYHPANKNRRKFIIMWHIYKNKQGKFEVAFITKGRYQVGSKQGYSRKSGCKKVLISVLKSMQTVSTNSLLFQDNTLPDGPKVFWIFKTGKTELSEVKPGKKYVTRQRT